MMDAEQEEDELENLSEAFFALSSVRRLRTLHLLTQPRSREELSEELGISRQAVSQHLDKLIEHGFVEEMEGWRESGPVAEFRVVPNRLFALGTTLVDLGKLEPVGGRDRVQSPRPTQHMEEGVEEASELEQGPAPHLLILDGPKTGERFGLEGDRSRWTIGRAEDRDLELDHDPYISGQQCEIQITPKGFAIVDTHSANGTMVNFARLPDGGRTMLEPGDVVRVGRTSLVFQRS